MFVGVAHLVVSSREVPAQLHRRRASYRLSLSYPEGVGASMYTASRRVHIVTVDDTYVVDHVLPSFSLAQAAVVSDMP